MRASTGFLFGMYEPTHISIPDDALTAPLVVRYLQSWGYSYKPSHHLYSYQYGIHRRMCTDDRNRHRCPCPSDQVGCNKPRLSRRTKVHGKTHDIHRQGSMVRFRSANPHRTGSNTSSRSHGRNRRRPSHPNCRGTER